MCVCFLTPWFIFLSAKFFADDLRAMSCYIMLETYACVCFCPFYPRFLFALHPRKIRAVSITIWWIILIIHCVSDRQMNNIQWRFIANTHGFDCFAFSHYTHDTLLRSRNACFERVLLLRAVAVVVFLFLSTLHQERKNETFGKWHLTEKQKYNFQLCNKRYFKKRARERKNLICI